MGCLFFFIDLFDWFEHIEPRLREYIG